MSLIAQSTNVLVPPFTRDLGGNTYQYETNAIGGRTNAIGGRRTKRRRHSQKRSRYSKRSTSRAGGRLKKRSLKK